MPSFYINAIKISIENITATKPTIIGFAALL